MKKTIEFLRNKMVLSAIMLFATSGLVLANILSLQNYVIKYDNKTIAFTTVPSLTEEELFEMAEIDIDLVLKAEVSQLNENTTEYRFYNTFMVNVEVDGEILSVETKATTLGNVLAKLDIKLYEDDIMSMSADQLLTNDTNVEIIRVTYEKTVETEYLDYQTVKRESMAIEFGETKVYTAGVLGEKAITTETMMYDGEIISSQVISEEILKEPVTHVIEYGSFNVNRGVTVTDGFITTVSGEVLSYSKIIEAEATAYTTERQTNKITKSGTIARVGAIAVDPRVIPLGSKLYITSANGTWIYGEAVAEDTGGVVLGNIIDLFFDTHAECISFGRQQAIVYVLS
ncbi:MAG: 3D domain-containing protein [Clostridia bacterium]